MNRTCGVYILTNKNNRVLYTGVTRDLETRLYDHKTARNPTSFVSRYRVYKLVYFEEFNSIVDAIDREKQIKSWKRQKKIELIEFQNPNWRDLSPDILGYDEDEQR